MKITLKAARVNVGLTQEQVAEKIGVSKHTIINWEKARSYPKKYAIEALCSIYQIDVEDLNIHL